MVIFFAMRSDYKRTCSSEKIIKDSMGNNLDGLFFEVIFIGTDSVRLDFFDKSTKLPVIPDHEVLKMMSYQLKSEFKVNNVMVLVD